MQKYVRKVCGLMAIAALLGALAFVLACGGDEPDEPESDPTATAMSQPEATATPQPTPAPRPTATAVPQPRATATPQPTPAPRPTATAVPQPTPIPQPTPTPEPDPTPTPEPASNLAGLVLNAETLGQQVVEGLSQEEAACVEGSLGGLLYQFFLEAAFTELITSGQSEAAGEFFGCLTPENVVHLGSAMLDYQAGGRAAQEQSCLTGVYLEHPDFMYRRLGMEPPSGLVTPAGGGHSIVMEMVSCLQPAGQIQLLNQFAVSMRSLGAATGAEIVDALDESGQTCLSEGLSETEHAALLDTQFNTFFDTAEALGDCVPEDVTEIYIAFVDGAVEGGLNEEATSCIAELAQTHAPFMARLTLKPGQSEETIPVATQIHYARDTAALLRCLNLDSRMPAVMNAAFAQPFLQ